MGAIMGQLGEALFSKSRRAVLSILYGQPDRAFYLREIADKAGVGMGQIQGDVPAAVEFGRVAAAPVNTLRQQPHRCQEISVCF